MVFSVGAYQGSLRRAIARYKFRAQRHLAPVFAGMVAAFLAAHEGWFEEFSVITAVPTYTGPGARRDWDPAGSVLAELPGRLGPDWAVEPGLVIKVQETPPMTGLGWSDRQKVARRQLRRSLAVAPGVDLRGAQVLVFDDVLTEGSTLHEVAMTLHRAGASDVTGLVLARAGWSPEPPRRRPM